MGKMNSEMKFCNRTGNMKSSGLSSVLRRNKSGNFFDTKQHDENCTGGGVRGSGNNMSRAYSSGECVQMCSSSQACTGSRAPIASVPKFQFPSDHSYDCVKVREGLQIESGNVLNIVKDDVVGEKGPSESCVKYEEKVIDVRGFVKSQAHYNAVRKDGEAGKGHEKSYVVKEQIGKHDTSSFVFCECRDEDGTGHLDEEDTFDSSEPSATLHTPLVFMHNNVKLREWIKPDLENVGSLPAAVCGTKARHIKEHKLSSGRKKSEVALDSCFVILPRAHGVNTKLMRTADMRQPSPTHPDLPSLSIKNLLINSSPFPLEQHRLSLFDEAKKALEKSLFQMVKFELHSTSAGGTYMVHCLPSVDANDRKMRGGGTSQHALAVFKPRNEEIGQERNPHGNCLSDREGFTPGSGSRREVLAYCLDHDHLAGIPPTLEVSAVYYLDTSRGDAMRPDLSETMTPRVCVGSLQLFVPNCIDAADVLPGKFLVEEVHALAIFDIRTLNSDRHGGNVLVHYEDGSWREAVPHLIPIDHSYVCPAGYADPDYEWLSWHQSKVPFSPELLDYIRRLDASADADLVAAALSANSVDQMDATSPGKRSLSDAVESDSSIATAQQILRVRNKQWMIEDLWVMSSPLCQRQPTPCAYGSSSHSDFPKSPKYKKLPCNVEDVQAAANTLYCATRLLQVAALEFGFTAYDIGNMCRRPRPTCPSFLEELIEGSLDEKTWETNRGVFELLLVKRLETAAVPLVEKQ